MYPIDLDEYCMYGAGDGLIRKPWSRGVRENSRYAFPTATSRDMGWYISDSRNEKYTVDLAQFLMDSFEPGRVRELFRSRKGYVVGFCMYLFPWSRIDEFYFQLYPEVIPGYLPVLNQIPRFMVRSRAVQEWNKDIRCVLSLLCVVILALMTFIPVPIYRRSNWISVTSLPNPST
jgi:hypothetical protein